MRAPRSLWLLLPLLLAPATACRGAYYATMEKFGVHKRDILVDEVEEGREEQQEAAEQFQTTYEVFRDLTHYKGGELEEVYETLSDELEDCEQDSDDLRTHIEDIERTASDLFDEWREELGTMENDSLRRQSETMLKDTRERYGDLIEAMERAEDKMEPVLVAFRDHVLFLKHNLNAKAIAALQDVVLDIEDDVATLIAEMQKSIAEADEFLKAMET
jgi:hypothetical protein